MCGGFCLSFLWCRRVGERPLNDESPWPNYSQKKTSSISPSTSHPTNSAIAPPIQSPQVNFNEQTKSHLHEKRQWMEKNYFEFAWLPALLRLENCKLRRENFYFFIWIPVNLCVGFNQSEHFFDMIFYLFYFFVLEGVWFCVVSFFPVKHNKSSGEDGIPAEFLRIGSETFEDQIIKHTMNCKIYRGIYMTNTAYWKMQEYLNESIEPQKISSFSTLQYISKGGSIA